MTGIDQQTSSASPISLERLRHPETARAEFARLVEEHSGMVYSLALKMLENQQDAEDVLQETFLKAYNNLDQFEGRSSISTWLYRIATNETLMLIRRKKDNQTSIDTAFEDNEATPEPLQLVDWCCIPEQELLSSETRAELSRAVDVMPSSMKIVFVLRDLEGLSTAETSEVLGLSETAVKTRLSRARFFLREQLSGYFHDAFPDQFDDNGRASSGLPGELAAEGVS